jgi:hypothetical protein
MTNVDTSATVKIVDPVIYAPIKDLQAVKTENTPKVIITHISTEDRPEIGNTRQGKAEEKFSMFHTDQSIGEILYDIAPLAAGVVTGGIAAATGAGAGAAIGIGIAATVGSAIVLPVVALGVGVGYFMISNMVPH